MATLEQVIAYLTQHRQRYPLESLRASLLKQGVPEALVDQAVFAVTAPLPLPTPQPDRAEPFPFRTPSQTGIPVQRAAPQPAPAPAPGPPEPAAAADDACVRAGGTTLVLASRASRLKARLADYAMVFTLGVGGALALPLTAGMPGMRPVAGALALALALGLAALAAAQLYLLATRGQTLGKRWMGIRIAKADTGANGGLTTNILLRAVAPVLVSGGVQLVSKSLGGLFGLADVLCIFRDDRRCLHDLIAGTIVVRAADAGGGP